MYKNDIQKKHHFLEQLRYDQKLNTSLLKIKKEHLKTKESRLLLIGSRELDYRKLTEIILTKLQIQNLSFRHIEARHIKSKSDILRLCENLQGETILLENIECICTKLMTYLCKAFFTYNIFFIATRSNYFISKSIIDNFFTFKFFLNDEIKKAKEEKLLFFEKKNYKDILSSVKEVGLKRTLLSIEASIIKQIDTETCGCLSQSAKIMNLPLNTLANRKKRLAREFPRTT